MSTFEEIIAASFTEDEQIHASRRAIDEYVDGVATVDGFHEKDAWLMRAARERAAELFAPAESE